MKTKIQSSAARSLPALLLTFALAFSGAVASLPALAASAPAPVQEVDSATLASIVRSNTEPIVVEFYDSRYDPSAVQGQAGSNDECLRQMPIFEAVAAEYAGQVTFLRFDIEQDQAMAQAGRLVVCPTHLFIANHFPDPTAANVPNRTPFRQWGLLSQAQFEELILTFFALPRPTP